MALADDEPQSRLEQICARVAELTMARPADDEDGRRELVQSLLDIYASLAQAEATDPQEVERIRAAICGNPVLAASLRGKAIQSNVLAHVWDIQQYAERGRYDGYKRACELRSALQLLLDDFSGNDLTEGGAEAEIEDADEELREAAEEAPPLHRRQIPSWAPRHHWWWWAPRQTGMSMREYRFRIFNGDLEEYERSTPGSADWLRCGDTECWCFNAPP